MACRQPRCQARRPVSFGSRILRDREGSRSASRLASREGLPGQPWAPLAKPIASSRLVKMFRRVWRQISCRAVGVVAWPSWRFTLVSTVSSWPSRVRRRVSKGRLAASSGIGGAPGMAAARRRRSGRSLAFWIATRSAFTRAIVPPITRPRVFSTASMPFQVATSCRGASNR